MQAAHGAVVTFSYTLTDDEGVVLDQNGEGMEYLHGYDNIIPGLEKALEGTAAGARHSVVVEAAEAYGEYDPAGVMTLARDVAEEHMELAVGMRVVGETEGGSVPLLIREVNHDSIVVDANHPLAGKRLHFEVEIVDVRAASDAELAQGYPE